MERERNHLNLGIGRLLWCANKPRLAFEVEVCHLIGK